MPAVQPAAPGLGGHMITRSHHEAATGNRVGPAILAAVTVLSVLSVTRAVHAAILPLPADGSQVNNDPSYAIDPNQDAGAVDVAGGTMHAGAAQEPWATFEQKVGTAQEVRARTSNLAHA